MFVAEILYRILYSIHRYRSQYNIISYLIILTVKIVILITTMTIINKNLYMKYSIYDAGSFLLISRKIIIK